MKIGGSNMPIEWIHEGKLRNEVKIIVETNMLIRDVMIQIICKCFQLFVVILQRDNMKEFDEIYTFLNR